MFTETGIGGGGSGTSTTDVIIISATSLVTMLGTAWFNRRPERRRTKPARLTDEEQLAAHKRITTLERNTADGRRGLRRLTQRVDAVEAEVDTLKAEQLRAEGRLEMIEERAWPTRRRKT